MPKVPSYNPYQVREAADPGVMSNIRVDRAALGGDTRGFDAAARLGQVAEKMQQDADDINVRDADLAAAQLQNRLEQSIKDMRGKNALGAPELLQSEWQKGMEEIEKSLASDRQKAKFDAVKKARFITLDSVASRHMGQEMRKHDDEQTSAYVATARDEALSNYKDPERVSLSLMQQEKAIMEHADRHGVSEDVRKLNLAEAKSKTHYGILSRHINNGEDLAAKEYFKTVVDQLTGVDKAAAEKILEEGSLRGEAQRRSDAIFNGSQDSMQGALEKAREIQDPKLRDEVVSRVKQRFGEKKQAEQMDIEGLHQRAGNILDKTPDVDAIPREEWSRFSISEKAALKRYAEDRAQGKQPATDWQTFYDLKNMASGPPALRDKFARENLMDMKYRGNLSDGDFKEMVKLQADIRAGKGESNRELDGYRSDQQIVNDSLNAAGIKSNPKAGTKDAERVARFRQMVDSHIKLQQDRTGKKATNEEVQGIVDRLLMQGEIPGTGFFGLFKSTKRLYEVDRGEKIAFSPEDIPMSERRRIEAALRANGIPVNDDNVFELFRQKVMTDANQ